ncbi:peptidase inhibitor family I36 protein [Actinosynnema sp. NPDC059797]
MRKKIAVVFSAAATMGAMLFGNGAAANAAEPGPVGAQALCPADQVCSYQTTEFGGMSSSGYAVGSGYCWPVSFDARSIVNNTYTVQRVWQHSNCTGQNMVIATNSFEIVPFTFRGRGGY